MMSGRGDPEHDHQMISKKLKIQRCTTGVEQRVLDKIFPSMMTVHDYCLFFKLNIT